MSDPLNSRRFVFGAARRYLLDSIDVGTSERRDPPRDEPPRLTFDAIQRTRMSRSRERILANLDDMYREAFERAKTSGDDAQMASLDFAYRREQLYFDILLDIRDGQERR